MLWSRQKQKPKAQRETPNGEPAGPSIPRPKILLIDLKDKSEAVLADAGYNVCSGTFGHPYKVEKADKYCPVIVEPRLPGHTEANVIVIDLKPPPTKPEPPGEKHVSPGEKDWWAKRSIGLVDPRPRAMMRTQAAFDRLLAHGSVFVVFARPRLVQDMELGAVRDMGFGLELVLERDIPVDNWWFLSTCHHRLSIEEDPGEEIELLYPDSALGRVLKTHIAGARFLCTIPDVRDEDNWLPIAVNRFNLPVAGVLTIPQDEDKQPGFVLILPDIKDKAAFLLDLLRLWLPDVAPDLFPHTEGGKWVQRSEYEIPKILEIASQIDEIEAATKQTVAELDAKIEQERQEHWYLHAILTETGDELVHAVKKCLEVAGFEDVVDADEELEAAGSGERRREDLQISDRSPLLLVEVKGIQSLPGDEDALQVWKYITPRIRQMDRNDIQGLSIINHQRNRRGLERDNSGVFPDDVLTNATEQGVGLLTTWDLYRIMRGVLECNWPRERVQEMFYRIGRIEPIPPHYECIGGVEKYFPKIGVVSIAVKNGGLRQRDRIAFELPTRYVEQDVDSLQCDHENVAQVPAGKLAGVKTNLRQEEARQGTRVFRVNLPTEP